MKIEELKERLAVLNQQAQSITRKADEDKRDLTREENQELKACLDAFDQTKADIDELNRLNQQTELLYSGQGRKTEPDQPAQPQIVDMGGGDVAALKPQPQPQQNGTSVRLGNMVYQPGPKNWGFNSLGEFALSVRRASGRGGEMEKRLQISQNLAATIYGNEGVGSEGGFAVPPDFRTQVMEAVMGEASLISLCDQITVSGNSFNAPLDMTTPWGTSGVQAYWGSEAGTKTQSKPALEEINVKLNKLYALVPMTDELLEDAPAMDAYLRRKAPEKISFKVNQAILQGTGVGQPLGILNSPALVTVADESGQQADTLVANNIIKMYSRMYAGSRPNARWVINQDVEPILPSLSLAGVDNTGNAVTGWGSMVYLPANGFSGSPFGSLFGRPIIPSEATETLGDLGDVFFIDFSQYLVILKSGPNPKVDVSMHLWFDQDVTAFRFVLRIGGIPWWSSTVASRDAGTERSPYVVLGERAG